jgi:hypothetical protein
MQKSMGGLPLVAAIAAVGVMMATGGERLAANGTERFTALAANLSDIGTGRTNRVDITIDRWSTEQEREELRVQLIENGTDAVFDALQEMEPVGRIRVDDGLGWDLRYAQEVDDGGKRRIVFATDRPIGVGEARAAGRTLDYKFMVGELRVGPEGRGEGQISPAVRLRYDHGLRLLELETLASQPIRLLQVRPI